MHNTDATFERDVEHCDEYSLSAEECRTLRRPAIEYPNGRVPVDVINACFNDGDLQTFAVDADGTVAIAELVTRVERVRLQVRPVQAVTKSIWPLLVRRHNVATATF